MKYGHAKEIYKNQFVYEGSFYKDLRSGIGRLMCGNKIVYSGEWKNNKFEGKGTIFYN